MESWEDELERALGLEIGFEEDMEDELENDLFLQMVDVVSIELLGEPSIKPKARGSVPRREYGWHDREVCHRLLVKDYFCDNLIYSLRKFRRQFGMRKELFITIHDVVVAFDPWFIQRVDCTKCLGLSSL
ncbi:hypothetical protein KC19_VG057400 [Ceratodon purpureus]|uniref:Uncharacterized protein n=1 Tax=Ceratodon purpureus TaxID=3225 RepID=A0A8T0HMV3_CERPU|nr:hypothetical protein KC19_VG057400 [Ceratodon purpureus]